jgi:hypothetical protein
MRLILLLCLIASNVLGQGLYTQIAKQKKVFNRNAYDDHRLLIIANSVNNGVSYNYASRTYFDGDLATKRSPNQGLYFPDSVLAGLDGTFEISKVRIYLPSSNTTLKILHGNNGIDWTRDTILSMNGSGSIDVNLHNIHCKFLNFVLDSNQGPPEIEVYGKPLSLDPILARVYRPKKTFRQLSGFNTNFSIPHWVYPDTGIIIREYDSMNKLMNRKSDTIFAFSPDYVQYIELDVHYQQNKTDGFITLPLFHQTPDSLFKESYVNAGQDFSYNSRAIQYGTDPYNPASWISKGRLWWQFAARYGKTSHPDSDLKIDLQWNAPFGNQKKSALDLAKWGEPDNERVSWFNGSDPNKFDLPLMVAAEGSALRDGHENRMGPRVGVKNADPGFKLIMGALADRDVDAVKMMYYWCQKNRTDKKFVYDMINFHEYDTDDGGFDDYYSKGIHPEAFKVRGYEYEGVKEAVNYFTDFIHRNLPGTEIMYSEWGWDACRASQVGVKLPTTAERAGQIHPLNSWQKQGAFTNRMQGELMASQCIDYSINYEIFNELRYTRANGELPDDVSDGPGNNPDTYYSPYDGGVRYNTSGMTLSEAGYKPATTASSINLSTLTNGTSITFNLKNKMPYVFTSPIHIRADDDDFSVVNAETIDGNITSQNDSTVTITVTGHTGTSLRNMWHFDAPFCKKPGWYIHHNAAAVIGNCKIIADSSTSEYRRYILSDSLNRTAEWIWLPTNSGNEITRTFNTVLPSATFRDLESYTGATSSVTVSGGKITTTIYEVPKIFYYDKP